MSQAHQVLITLAGGCFWCVESVFEQVRGITATEVGYCNGHTNNPTYEQICGGDTGHVEAVRVYFDDTQINLDTVLGIFFAVHDPKTLNRQGNDVGEQYRSGIYTHDDAQLAQVRAIVANIAQEHFSGQKVVTEIVHEARYQRAEDYHQHYFTNNPNQGYCLFTIPPKLKKLRQLFTEYVKK